jgi:signal transduction histidine kinase
VKTLAFGVMGATSTGLYLWLTIYALRRQDRPGALPLTLLAAVLVATSALLALNTAVGLASPRFFGYGLLFATLLWTAFTLEYTGRGPAMTRNRLVGLVGFAVAVVVVQALIVTVFDLGFPYWLFISATNLTVISTGGFGVFLVVRSGVTYDDLPLVRALVVAGIGATIVLIWIVGIIVGEQLDLETVFEAAVSLLLVAGGGLCVLAQHRYDLLESEPSAGYLARDSVFDEMAEAVVVSDRKEQLLDSNRMAEQVFDIDPSMLGQPIEQILGTALDSYDGDSVTIDNLNGRREYEVRQSPVRETTEKSVGTVYLLRDVTDQQTHEQQLAVLNRVLRHNLRNDFDSIRGFAEPIRDGKMTADEAAELGERIADSAQQVRELGEKVSRAERLLDWESLDREPVDLNSLAKSVASEMDGRYPEGSVTVAAPSSTLPVRTNREILHAIVAELVDNGLKHGERADPQVSIELDSVEGGITIAVRDDGTSIPEHERAVLLDGEETPLRHGTGIGLWFVYWGIRRLGGTISFAENQPKGSVVRLTLPTID